jgi:hypothetical protein
MERTAYVSPIDGATLVLAEPTSIRMTGWVQACTSADGCVEVASVGDRLFVRSSHNPDRVLDLDRDEWGPFLKAVKAGALDGV